MSKTCPNCQGHLGPLGEKNKFQGPRMCGCRQESHGRIDPKENVYPVTTASMTRCPHCLQWLRITACDPEEKK